MTYDTPAYYLIAYPGVTDSNRVFDTNFFKTAPEGILHVSTYYPAYFGQRYALCHQAHTRYWHGCPIASSAGRVTP